MEYPRWKSSLMNHLDPNIWSSSTLNSNSKGSITNCGLAAHTKHWLMAALFTVNLTIGCRNICNIEGNHWHVASTSRMSSFYREKTILYDISQIWTLMILAAANSILSDSSLILPHLSSYHVSLIMRLAMSQKQIKFFLPLTSAKNRWSV